MAANDQYDISSDFPDLEEPKSPTFSLDLGALLSDSNIPFPYQVGPHLKNDRPHSDKSVSPESDIPKSPTSLKEKGTVQPSLPCPDKRPLAFSTSKRQNARKTLSIDLSSLRVKSSELANVAHLEGASALKENVLSECFPTSQPSAQKRKDSCSNRSTDRRYGHLKPAALLPPKSHCTNPSASHDLARMPAASNASTVDCTNTVDIANMDTIDLIEGNTYENRPPVPVSSISRGAESSSFCRSKNNASEQSKVYVKVNGEPYQVIRVLGEGGSSKVYEVFSSSLQLMAIKCVNLKTADKSICESYRNEISVLHRLQGSDRVIKLYDHEFKKEEKMLYVVLERGDVDLATIIMSNTKHGTITPEMVKFYWSEMLRAVEVIHNEGIIHSDLKPANFLLVAGQLKLIDFGIASTIPTDATSIIKDSRSGTPSYMSPEAFLDTCEDSEGGMRIKIGVKSDVWSLGCILYHMVYQCTPFHHIRDPMKKMLTIVNPNYDITFKPLNDVHLLDVLKKCIVRDPKHRASISELLQHPYLTSTSRLQHPLASLMNSISELSPTSIQRISQVVGELKMKK